MGPAVAAVTMGTVSHISQSYLHGHLVVVIDCADRDRSTQFWTSALGYAHDGPPGGTYLSLVPADGQGIEILLRRVPEVRAARTAFTWICAPPTSTPRLIVSLCGERYA
jgi:hypothetical protein